MSSCPCGRYGVPCWRSSTADREMTCTSAVGATRVTSQVTGAARAPASDTSNGTTSGTFFPLVAQRIRVVTP